MKMTIEGYLKLGGTAVAAVVTVVSASWGLSSRAAANVMAPMATELKLHKQQSRDRLHVMCAVARYQIDAAEKTCLAVGTKCPRPLELSPEILNVHCEDRDP